MVETYLLNGGEGVLHGLDETTDEDGSASDVASRRLELGEHGGKVHQIQPCIRAGGEGDTNGGKCVAMWSTPC